MLVVDDDPPSRKLLEGYLRAEGYDVHSAPDGPTALAEARDRQPDVILLDVMMPEMTGHEVCEILKRDPETRLCQIMMVTALGSVPDQVEGLDTGADDYLAKPVRRDEFLAKVRALLRARRLLLELEQARHELAARNRELELKKTLAQSLVHDLKSPLSAVLGNLDLLDRRAGETQRPLIQRSRQGATRMLKMILNLLDVEGLEEGRLTPTVDRVDVAELARKAVEDARVSAEQRGVVLDLHGDGPVWAEADPLLLRRVVDNLLANALAHSPRRGTVELSVEYRVEGIEIGVRDAGAGVPEEWREKIFEKYAQAEAQDSPLAGANRGLGLTFCRLAVEAHGGTIWVERAPGGGAWFRTVLPAAAAGAGIASDAVANR